MTPEIRVLLGNRSWLASLGDSGSRLTVARALLPLGFATRKVLPALDDHVAVGGIQFHQEGPAAGLFGGNQRRTAATKEVENILAWARRVLDCPHGQLHRLLRQMNHALWVDFLDRPYIGNVVRTEELVGCSLTPAVEGELEIPHEIFPSEDRMTFGPNDGLGEIQTVGLQKRREVAEVAVTRPAIVGSARQ